MPSLGPLLADVEKSMFFVIGVNFNGWSRKGGSLRITLNISEKEVRPKRRFGHPTSQIESSHILEHTEALSFFH